MKRSCPLYLLFGAQRISRAQRYWVFSKEFVFLLGKGLSPDSFWALYKSFVSQIWSLSIPEKSFGSSAEKNISGDGVGLMRDCFPSLNTFPSGFKKVLCYCLRWLFKEQGLGSSDLPFQTQEFFFAWGQYFSLSKSFLNTSGLYNFWIAYKNNSLEKIGNLSSIYSTHLHIICIQVLQHLKIIFILFKIVIKI